MTEVLIEWRPSSDWSRSQVCREEKLAGGEMQREQSVSVRELSERASEITRQVRVNGISVEITDRGKVIAQLIPARESKAESKEASAVWTDLERLATEIGARWPAKVSAVDTVR
jgi:prevent-host-death family protein